MKCLTISRGEDGFGSQLFSIISGLAYCDKHKIPYKHSPIQNIKLLSSKNFLNEDLIRSNEFVFSIINNIDISKTEDLDCTIKPFCHDLIYNEGSENYFTENFLEKIKSSHTFNFGGDQTRTISIHIRRGEDIFDEDKPYRWIESETYQKLIEFILEKESDCKIKIFSWGESGIRLSDARIEYHTSDSGGKFMDDFIKMVTSDILIVGSSTFSISAGFLNKNMVLSHTKLMKLNNTPIPRIWENNFNTYFNGIDI